MRGGYSRTYDLLFNVAILGQVQYGSFPFVKSVSLSAVPNAVAALQAAAVSPVSGDVNLLKRAMVSPDMRSSHAEQFALQLQRQLKTNWVLNIGYVGTKGTALLETVDANPTLPGSAGRQRLDPTRGVLLMKCNCTSSIYHSLQASVEKRLSSNFSMAAHYTWSSFIDGASDILNPSPTGEIGFPQNSFNRSADRGRSAWDRPQRVAVNGVFELPFFRHSGRVAGHRISDAPVRSALLRAGRVRPGTPLERLGHYRPRQPQHQPGCVADVHRANPGRGRRRTVLSCHGRQSIGNMGRNMLRSSRLMNLDLGLVKNMRFLELHTLQLRAEFYNTSNTRYFGIPDATLSSANFLNQWGTDGGNRRIVFTLRYAF